MLRRAAIALALALLACGVAEGMGHILREGSPCAPHDRRCVAGASGPTPPPAALLWVLYGGPDAGQVANGAAVTGSAGQTVSISRGSATECTDGGFFGPLASNTFCTEPGGVAVRPATTNILPHTADWSDWTQDTATFTSGQTCPDGTTGGVLMTDTVANGGHRVYKGLTGSAGYYALSMYAKLGPDSTAGCLRLLVGSTSEQAVFDLGGGTVSTVGGGTVFGGFSAQNIAVNMVPSEHGFYRISYAANDVTGAGFAQIYMGKTCVQATGSYVGGDAGIILCDPLAANIQDTRAYVVNDGGSTATRSADAVSVANPLSNGATQFALSARVTADNWRYDSYITRGVLQLGYDAGDSDTASLYVTDGGSLVFSVVDHAGGVAACQSNTVLWAGTRFLRVVDNAGALSMSMDGTALPCTSSGAGTGLITTEPGTAYLGSLGPTAQFGGVLSDICIDNTTTGCAATARTIRPAYTAKTLIALGDSLTQNVAGWHSSYWPEMLALDLPLWTTTNAGTPTYQIAQGTVAWADAGMPKTQYTSIEFGINDSLATGYTTDAWLEFWFKQLWDSVSANGSTPVIIRESPWGRSASWSAGEQTHYDTLQTWIASEAATFGYPYVDLYDGGMLDAGTGPPTLNCLYDYDTDGVSNVCGGAAANYVHLNDAGQGFKENQVRSVLGI